MSIAIHINPNFFPFTGEVTSHIQGMFSRTIRMMEAGCKPAYVFDGKPPDMKGGKRFSICVYTCMYVFAAYLFMLFNVITDDDDDNNYDNNRYFTKTK